MKLGSALLLPTWRRQLLPGRVSNRAVTGEYKALFRVNTTQTEHGAVGKLNRNQDLIIPHELSERGQRAPPASDQRFFSCCLRQFTGAIERQTAQSGDPIPEQRLCFDLVLPPIHWPVAPNLIYLEPRNTVNAARRAV